MKKIIGLLWTIFAYFCIATVLAELNLAAYVIFGWKLDGDRMTHIIAIAQGKELPRYDERNRRGEKNRNSGTARFVRSGTRSTRDQIPRPGVARATVVEQPKPTAVRPNEAGRRQKEVQTSSRFF